jgi:cysteinyl-tRNA synthetase
VHEQVRAGNTALDDGDREGALAAAAAVREMTGVLGLDPLDPHWAAGVDGSGGDHARSALGALVGDLLGQRTAARREKDFARADAIRDQLTAAGVGIEDTPDGPIWTLKDDES